MLHHKHNTSRSAQCDLGLKRVYFRHDSKCYVQFRLCWLSEMVWSDLCKHMVWHHQKMLKLLKQILSCSHSKNLFDSISEGAWKLPSYLFLIFCWFHVNNNNIPIVMRHTCEHMQDLFIATAVKQGPRRDCKQCASAISKLKFSNTILKIFFLRCITHQPCIYEMKYESAQI